MYIIGILLIRDLAILEFLEGFRSPYIVMAVCSKVGGGVLVGRTGKVVTMQDEATTWTADDIK